MKPFYGLNRLHTLHFRTTLQEPLQMFYNDHCFITFAVREYLRISFFDCTTL